MASIKGTPGKALEWTAEVTAPAAAERYRLQSALSAHPEFGNGAA